MAQVRSSSYTFSMCSFPHSKCHNKASESLVELAGGQGTTREDLRQPLLSTRCASGNG